MNKPETSERACPPDEILARVAGGAGSEAEERAVGAHLDECTRCQKRFEAFLGPTEDLAALGRENEEAVRADLRALRKRRIPRPPTIEVGSRDVVIAGALRLGLPRRPEYLASIGDYQVIAILGQGGMGVVLKAFDEKLERIVALKLIGPKLVHDEAARQRFLREARSAAKLKHPNVVAIHAVGTHATIPFIDMEYVEGSPLSVRIAEEGCLEPNRAAEIIRQVLSALGHAHEAGIIHRDIKPGNVLLESQTGAAKLSDFGLARGVGDAIHPTVEGTVLGTPCYMSPEQASAARQLDGRSDLFSAGVMMFEMLAGALPFPGHDSHEVLRRIREEATPEIGRINPSVPRALAAIVNRAMEKDPSRRYRSAAQFIQAIDECLAAGTALTETLPGQPAAAPAVESGLVRCAACSRQIASRLSVAGQCEQCGAPICAACWTARGVRRCDQHKVTATQPGRTPAAERAAEDMPPIRAGVAAPAGSVASGTDSERSHAPRTQASAKPPDVPSLSTQERVAKARAAGKPAVSADEARVAEDTFLRLVANALESVTEMLDPCRQVTFKVGGWSKAARRTLRPARGAPAAASDAADPKAPADGPGAVVTYDLRRRGLGWQQARVVVAAHSLARVERFLRDGMDDAPIAQVEIESFLNETAERARREDAWHLVLLFSPTGFAPEASDFALGRGARPFRDRHASAVLFDARSMQFAFDESDPKLLPLREAFSAGMDSAVLERARGFLQDYFQLHESISVETLVEQLGISRKAAAQVFEALAARGEYALSAIDEVGMVLCARD